MDAIQMKLKPEELQQINTRKEIIAQRQKEVGMLSVELQILRRESNQYNTKLLEDYKLDPKKKYEITDKGEINPLPEEVKAPKIQPIDEKNTKVDPKDA